MSVLKLSICLIAVNEHHTRKLFMVKRWLLQGVNGLQKLWQNAGWYLGIGLIGVNSIMSWLTKVEYHAFILSKLNPRSPKSYISFWRNFRYLSLKTFKDVSIGYCVGNMSSTTNHYFDQTRRNQNIIVPPWPVLWKWNWHYEYLA